MFCKKYSGVNRTFTPCQVFCHIYIFFFLTDVSPLIRYINIFITLIVLSELSCGWKRCFTVNDGEQFLYDAASYNSDPLHDAAATLHLADRCCTWPLDLSKFCTQNCRHSRQSVVWQFLMWYMVPFFRGCRVRSPAFTSTYIYMIGSASKHKMVFLKTVLNAIPEIMKH